MKKNKKNNRAISLRHNYSSSLVIMKKNKKNNWRMKRRRKMLVFGFVFTILLVSVAYYAFTRPNYVTLTVEVSSPHDDARTFITTVGDEGYGDEDGGWAMLQLAPSYSFGVRFVNVTVPHGAKVKDAYVELYSVGTPGHDHPNCRIYCDASDNADNFSVRGVLDRCGRVYTENFTRWNETVSYGKWIKTPSIAPQVQEVINRENWTSGNAIAVLFVSEGLRGYSATFQNYENGYPARLHIVFEKKRG
ncbi:MAG TPA: hypothetical protein ENI42_07035 [Thermoplasmatales archaeon]|nr:hypothetical protein [Thermoplasmatales archaeon]